MLHLCLLVVQWVERPKLAGGNARIHLLSWKNNEAWTRGKLIFRMGLPLAELV